MDPSLLSTMQGQMSALEREMQLRLLQQMYVRAPPPAARGVLRPPVVGDGRGHLDLQAQVQLRLQMLSAQRAHALQQMAPPMPMPMPALGSTPLRVPLPTSLGSLPPLASLRAPASAPVLRSSPGSPTPLANTKLVAGGVKVSMAAAAAASAVATAAAEAPSPPPLPESPASSEHSSPSIPSALATLCGAAAMVDLVPERAPGRRQKRPRSESMSSATSVATDAELDRDSGRSVRAKTQPSKKKGRAKKTFACSFPGCKSSFNTRFSLRRHFKKHTGERPHACTWPGCPKRFAEKSTLKRHIRVHTGEKPYVCAIEGCNKRFADRTNVKRHQLTSHDHVVKHGDSSS